MMLAVMQLMNLTATSPMMLAVMPLMTLTETPQRARAEMKPERLAAEQLQPLSARRKASRTRPASRKLSSRDAAET
jgi:hypothetical protein